MTRTNDFAHRLLAALVLTGSASAAALAGCSDLAAECRAGDCLASGASGTSNVGTSGSGGSGGSGAGGAGGAAPESCDPSVAAHPVADSCGVFVSSSLGTDTSQGNGTKNRPYATLAKALAALDASGGNSIYLCGESFTGSVVLPSGVSIFGALDCKSNWTYAPATRSTLFGDANTVALRVTGVSATQLRDLTVNAADATLDGASSVAMLVDGASVDLDRVALVAGNAKAGADGATPGGTGSVGLIGTNAKAACSAPAMVPPLDPPTLDCGSGESSTGGYGGAGFASTAGNGSDGSASPAIDNPNGGTGQTTSNGSVCTAGKPGLGGTNGVPGMGAMGPGKLDAKEGYVGVAGSSGMSNGHAGQGGGGGGGASGKQVCIAGTNAGPAGASGGTGGCGGLPGSGGAPGGSSLGLVSLGAKVTLAHTTITAAKGGAGGKGSDGQPGGLGVSGGVGAPSQFGSSCNGGKGGDGGRGGAGGGGLGGHSIAVAFTGTEPKRDLETVTLKFAAPGDGGLGGSGGLNNLGGKGASGLASEVNEFSAQ